MSVDYPFTALVGQEDLVEALMICVVAPDVGGVLIRGERGNAKSTAVRGLAALLAPAPLVEVPLGATLDRLVGSLDVARALAGQHAVEPGLLSRADGGMLYVDEVNLLPDHLVDAMLDAAASGVVRVEREGVSQVHDARFTLIGTMNVEEGELRPQLLDRFGLGIDVRTPGDPLVRADIVRRRLAFEADPAGFTELFAAAGAEVAVRLAGARALYPRVRLPERELLRITSACSELAVDGVRGDLVTARAARALAALDGADEVTGAHVRRAAQLALAHRQHRDPLHPASADQERLERAFDLPPDLDPLAESAPPQAVADPSAGRVEPAEDPGTSPPEDDGPAGGSPSGAGPGSPGSGDVPPGSAGAGGGSGAGGRGAAAGPGAGRRPPPGGRSVAPVQALLPPEAWKPPRRTAGPSTASIDTRAAGADSQDVAVVGSLLRGGLRQHVRAGREGALLCLVIDASGSMRARRRGARVKGALLELLREAYARRDRVAVISFRGSGAEVLAAPGAPLERAVAAIRDLRTGGRTPLADGLITAAALIRRERIREPDRASIAMVLTDGRAPDHDGAITRAAAELGRLADVVSIIDTEDGPVRLGLARRLAAAAGGERYGFAA